MALRGHIPGILSGGKTLTQMDTSKLCIILLLMSNAWSKVPRQVEALRRHPFKGTLHLKTLKGRYHDIFGFCFPDFSHPIAIAMVMFMIVTTHSNVSSSRMTDTLIIRSIVLPGLLDISSWITYKLIAVRTSSEISSN